MHHPTDRIEHTTTFVAPVMEHWLERVITQWVHPMKDRSDNQSHHERTLLPQSYISLPQWWWILEIKLNSPQTKHFKQILLVSNMHYQLNIDSSNHDFSTFVHTKFDINVNEIVYSRLLVTVFVAQWFNGWSEWPVPILYFIKEPKMNKTASILNYIKTNKVKKGQVRVFNVHIQSKLL